MTTFAKLDNNNEVIEVIIAEQNFIDSEVMGSPIDWVTGSRLGKGYTYDKINDVFISPKPYSSWTLDNNQEWQPPSVKPDDGKYYKWNESDQSWIELPE
jgi:hypothetical protein